MSEFTTSLCDIRKELNYANDSLAGLALLVQIEELRKEADSGVIHDANKSKVIVENAELADLVFTVCAENWLGLFAGQDSRQADSKRHTAAFIKAEKEIYSDRFTPEEQGKAWQVLD